MPTYTVIADIGNGDETTDNNSLFFKIYNNDVLIYTTGNSVDDPDVNIIGTAVTIVFVTAVADTNVITITQVDESHNESNKSNSIVVGSTGMYASGMYASGMYA